MCFIKKSTDSNGILNVNLLDVSINPIHSFVTDLTKLGLKGWCIFL